MIYSNKRESRKPGESAAANHSANPATANKPWVVLIHGLTCDHTDWQPVIEALPTELNILTVDLRGHGQSADLAGPYNLDKLASDVVATLERSGITDAVLVGHSMGTRIIASINEQMPTLCRGLVFVDGSRQAEGSAEQAQTFYEKTLPVGADCKAFITSMFGSMFTPSRENSLQEAIVLRALATPEPVFRELLNELLLWDATRLPESIRKIECPLSVLQSTTLDENRQRTTLKANQQTPYTAFIEQQVPHATTMTIPDTGHFSQIEAPSIIVDSIVSLIHPS